MDDRALREHLGRLLDWHDAHVDFDAAVDRIAPEWRGRRPAGGPHSPWEILEHLRLAQGDILDFCVNANYEEKAWPDDYWPASPAPPDATAWDHSVAAYRRDRQSMQTLAREQPDLGARIPHGSGQTYLREILLVADHGAYHVGELVLVRRLLGIWPGA